MKASLTNHRQAPRKMRVVAHSLKGKRVSDVLANLSFMPKKAAQPLQKLIASAVANARQMDSNVSEDSLFIKSITVDKGITYNRYMPRAFGRASAIRKESSHVLVTLEDRQVGQNAKTKGQKVIKNSRAKRTK